MATVMMLAPVMAMTEATPTGCENDKGGDNDANGKFVITLATASAILLGPHGSAINNKHITLMCGRRPSPVTQPIGTTGFENMQLCIWQRCAASPPSVRKHPAAVCIEDRAPPTSCCALSCSAHYRRAVTGSACHRHCLESDVRRHELTRPPPAGSNLLLASYWHAGFCREICYAPPLSC